MHRGGGGQPRWLFLSLPLQHLIIEPPKKKKIQQGNLEELSLPGAPAFSSFLFLLSFSGGYGRGLGGCLL